jgi:hypothetical protein
MANKDPIVKVTLGNNTKYTPASAIIRLGESYSTLKALGGKAPRMTRKNFNKLPSIDTQHFDATLNWHHTRRVGYKSVEHTLAYTAQILNEFLSEETA